MNKKCTGFTLVEVVVAAVLVTTVAAVILPAFISAARWGAPTVNWGYNLAQSDLAALHEAPDGPLWDINDPSRNPLSLGRHDTGDPGVMVVAGRTYKTWYEATPVVRDGKEDYRKVKATVSWLK